MAKKKNNAGLIFNIVIIALAVLVVCTLFMPVLNVTSLIASKEATTTAVTGMDVFTGAFAAEASMDLSNGANMIYGLRTADENTFTAIVMIWSYMLTVGVSVATLVFAVLNLLGMRFKLVNTILGAALVVLGIVAFIFTLVVASQNTSITEVAGYETGVRVVGAIAAYCMFAGVAAGALQLYNAKK